MKNHRPLILITNDDGIDAPGIHALIEFTAEFGNIIVYAPTSAQSGKASAITVEEPLRVTAKPDYCGASMNAVSGTPVDCIKLALHIMSDCRPDLILSGINHGSNSGNSVIYSGTMGAVMEGCMNGIPSIGFSLLHHSWAADFSQCASTVIEVTSRVLAHGLPDEVCLNVNIPARCTPKGIKVTEASRGHWTEEYADYSDPHGRPFFLLTGRYIDENPGDNRTDNYWLDREYATIVPVRPDQTARDALSTVSRIMDISE